MKLQGSWVAVGFVFGAVVFACSSSSNTTTSSSSSSGGGTSAGSQPASNCAARCSAATTKCGADSSSCGQLCTSITETQLSCIEAAGCDQSAGQACLQAPSGSSTSTTSSSGVTNTSSTSSSGSSDCKKVTVECAGSGECCGFGTTASCTQRLGDPNSPNVCCTNPDQACGSGQECCSGNCSTAGKCCYGSSTSCSQDNAAQCCSGTCGSNGFCNP